MTTGCNYGGRNCGRSACEHGCCVPKPADPIKPALGAKPANNAFCFCTKCGCTHSVSYAPCDGLRGGYSSAEPPQEGPELTAPALARQEGGQHYKAMAIQPFEYLLEVGRVQVRTTEGATLAGLRQARHFLDLLIEAEQTAQDRST